MPSAHTLVAFLTATLMMLLVPGPAVVYVITRSIEQGRLAGLWSMLGIETGTLLHVGAAVVGLTALLTSSPTMLHVVRYAGAAYLLYLGARQILRRRRTSAPDATPCLVQRRRLYRDGVLVDLLNPQTGLFFIAFLPQFIDPARGPAPLQVVVLGLVFVGVAVVCEGGYVLCAGFVGRRIHGSPDARRHFEKVTGGVYVGLGAVAALALT